MSYLRINQKAEKYAAAIADAIGIVEPTIADVLQWFHHNFDYTFVIKKVDLSRQPISAMVHANGPKGHYKILVSDNEPIERQLFSVYHELGHLLQEQGLVYGCFDGDEGNKKEKERFCNRFAAAMLMPAESFRKLWTGGHTNLILRRFMLAEHYGVSKEAIANRAIDLGLT